MRSTLIATVALSVFVATPAHAANLAVIATPPGFLAIVILACACACIAMALKIQSVIKGGMLSKGWLFFVVGFAVLALTQIVSLLNSMEVLAAPEWLSSAMLVLMAAIFLYAVLSTKRVLE